LQESGTRERAGTFKQKMRREKIKSNPPKEETNSKESVQEKKHTIPRRAGLRGQKKQENVCQGEPRPGVKKGGDWVD